MKISQGHALKIINSLINLFDIYNKRKVQEPSDEQFKELLTATNIHSHMIKEMFSCLYREYRDVAKLFGITINHGKWNADWHEVTLEYEPLQVRSVIMIKVKKPSSSTVIYERL